MAIRFIDLEKAYTIITRELTMGTLVWIGLPGVRSDWWRGHEEQGAVWTGSVRRVQTECWPDSALVPLLFIAVAELIRRKICTKDVPRKLMNADGLAVVAYGKQISKNS